MTPPGTFERVYAAIKQRLREGRYKPSERLEPAILSEELNASVTPVRDALHRLTGERLVEAPRHEGFRAPMLTETMLRQLYAWHLDLLLLALMKRSALPASDVIDQVGGDTEPMACNALFIALAKSAGNPEHATAVRALLERLEPVQRVEAVLFDEIETETTEIVRAIHAQDRAALRRSTIAAVRRWFPNCSRFCNRAL